MLGAEAGGAVEVKLAEVELVVGDVLGVNGHSIALCITHIPRKGLALGRMNAFSNAVPHSIVKVTNSGLGWEGSADSNMAESVF